MSTEIIHILNKQFECSHKELIKFEKNIFERIHLVAPGEPYEFGWIYDYRKWYLLTKGKQNFYSICMSYSVRNGRLPFEFVSVNRKSIYPYLYQLKPNLDGGKVACQLSN